MKIGSAPEARLKLPAIRHTTPKKQAAAASVNAAWDLHRTAKKNTADAKKFRLTVQHANAPTMNTANVLQQQSTLTAQMRTKVMKQNAARFRANADRYSQIKKNGKVFFCVYQKKTSV